jgi:hypothetical protein
LRAASALGQHLGVRADLLDVLAPAGGRDQVVRYLQIDLAAQQQVGGVEQVQGVVDHALGGVLHRHHSEVGAPPLHGLEDVEDAGQGPELGRVAEVLQGGQVGEGGLRAEVGGRGGPLQPAPGAHDLAEDGPDVIGGQRPRVEPGQPVEYLALPRGVQHRAGAPLRLQAADLADHLHAPVEGRQYLLVQGVDLAAQPGQVRR